MQGLILRKNKNGFIVARLHYSADPKKSTKEWYDKTHKGYSEAAWRKEYEIDFEVLSGTLVYDEYNQNVHLIPKRLINENKLRTEGSLYRVLDHGQVNPTAVIWVWVDREDNWIVYREYYVANQTVPFHASNIKKLSDRESYSETIADPSIFYKTQQDGEGNMFSIAQRYNEHGITFTPGNNDFQSGSDTIKERLKVDPERINPWTGTKGSPSIFFVKEECQFLDWEIRKWRYQQFTSLRVAIDKNPKETPVDKDNHLMDTLTYFANAKKEGRQFDEDRLTFVQKDIKKILENDKDNAQSLLDQFNTV